MQTFGVIQIGGPIATLAEAESFIALARTFGATDDTPLPGAYLGLEFIGTPVPATNEDGTVTASIPLTAYSPDE